MARKGGGTIEEQRARLEEKLGDERTKRARKWAHDDPDGVRYAFRCLEKSKKEVLTKKEQTFYDQMVAIDQKAADRWKQEILSKK